MAELRSVRLGVVSVLMVAASSSENAAAAEIHVQGPRSCSRATELRTRVEDALGRSLSELGALSCRVHVVRDGGSYAARVELSSTEQARSLQRSFSAKTCPKLMDTLELAVVLAMGADGASAVDSAAETAGASVDSGQTALARRASAGQRASSESNSGRTGPSDTALTAGASPLAKAAPMAKAPVAFTGLGSLATSLGREPAAASSDVVRSANGESSADRVERAALWRAFGGVVVDAGALPSAALGAQLGGSVGSDLELRALGTYLLPREAALAAPDVATHGVDFTLAAASLLGCAPRLAQPGSVELGLCAGGELGGLWSGRNDLPGSRATRVLWSALRADVGARWEVASAWLAIDTRLGLSVPLRRPRFTVTAEDDGPSEVYRPSAIGGRLSVAATFALDGSR